MAGYHVAEILRGEYGELSKVEEEVREARDSEDQGNRLMTLLELSDVIGAIDGYLRKHHPTLCLDDLVEMSMATRRAFETGGRK